MDRWALKVESEFKNFAKLLGVANVESWLAFEPSDDGSPHVEIQSKNQFCYVVTERGSEIERRSTRSLDQLMYWLFSDVTFSIASKYELKHRHPTNDFRRLLFSKQLELLGVLSKKWEDLRKQDLEVVLANNPYEDEIA